MFISIINSQRIRKRLYLYLGLMLLWIVQIVICNSSWLTNICLYRLTIKWTSHSRTIILGWRILQIYFFGFTQIMSICLYGLPYTFFKKFMNIKLRHFLLFLSKELDLIPLASYLSLMGDHSKLKRVGCA